MTIGSETSSLFSSNENEVISHAEFGCPLVAAYGFRLAMGSAKNTKSLWFTAAAAVKCSCCGISGSGTSWLVSWHPVFQPT
jgi:hypothetical protein